MTVVSRGLGVAVVLGLAAPVMASPVALVTVQPNWKLDREKSMTMNAASQRVPHFGTAPSLDVTEAYFPEVGIALIVTRSTATKLPDGRDTAIAAIVDELESSLARAETSGTTITDKTSDRVVTPGGKSLEVSVAGTDTGAGVKMRSRMVIAADATSLVAVTGLCIARDGSTPALVDQCSVALGTLDPGIAAADRVVLAFPAVVPVVTASSDATTTAPTMSVPGHEARPHREPARLDDGSRAAMEPIRIAPKSESDRRPIYVGIGLVILALAFYWNRKQRDRFAREDRAAGATPGTSARRQRASDGDADDLHAAAADDAKPENDDDASSRPEAKS